MKVDLMALADVGSSPERLANAILLANPDLPIPVPIDALAEAVGIERIEMVETDGFEGVLVANPEKSRGEIAVRAGSSLARRRFTIAHEIGHFLIQSHDARVQCASADLGVFKTSDAARAKEAEANRFAAAILMPATQLRRDIRVLGPPELTHIVTLADRYQVSREAMARRYAQLIDHACAIVFSKDGRVRYVTRGDEFPFLAISPGSQLPLDSATAADRSLANGLSSWLEVDESVWLSRPSGRGQMYYEQSLIQQNGFRMTMLMPTEDAEPEEDNDDEEEGLTRRWTPRFRR